MNGIEAQLIRTDAGKGQLDGGDGAICYFRGSDGFGGNVSGRDSLQWNLGRWQEPDR